MYDIHSHILYDLDDGSQSLETTLDMLNTAVSEGITVMIATPHYICGANKYDYNGLIIRYMEVRELIDKHRINIKLMLGNELFLDEELPKHLKNGTCLSLAGTDYILAELPSIGIPTNMEAIFHTLVGMGYKPILAHPERHSQINSDISVLIKWIQMGWLIQVNQTSITGMSGKEVKEAVRIMLKSDMVHFVATDCHSNRRRAPKLGQAYDMVKDWIGVDKAGKIFYENPEKLLKNEQIDIIKPELYREYGSKIKRILHKVILS